MIDLKYLIQKTDLRIIGQEKQIGEQQWMAEALYLIDGENTIARYVFFYVDAAFFLDTSESEESFTVFEKRYLEPIFFSLDGDLRWNLYCVFILSDADFNKIPEEKRLMVEGDKSYARKLVLAESNFLSAIPLGQIKGAIEAEVADPYEDWFRLLESEGLEFCLEEYWQDNIIRYLNGDIGNKNENESSNETSREKIEEPPVFEDSRIGSLYLGSAYRQECFDPDNSCFHFSQINLLEGANGSGKTSVLEAIERAITNEINKEKGSRSSKQEKNISWDGFLIFRSGEKLDSSLDSTQRRQMERVLYESGGKRTSKLNESFHRYNYFSLETAYNYGYSGSYHPNYQVELQRLVFGENIGELQANWQHYQNAFDMQHRELIRKGAELQEQIELIHGVEIEGPSGSCTIPAIETLLKGAAINFPAGKAPDNIRQRAGWLEELYSYLLELQSLAGIIPEMQEIGIFTMEQLVAAIRHIEEELEDIQKYLKTIASEIHEIEEKDLPNSEEELGLLIRKYLKDNPELVFCPFCGTNHGKAEVLQEAVNSLWGDTAAGSSIIVGDRKKELPSAEGKVQAGERIGSYYYLKKKEEDTKEKRDHNIKLYRLYQEWQGVLEKIEKRGVKISESLSLMEWQAYLQQVVEETLRNLQLLEQKERLHKRAVKLAEMERELEHLQEEEGRCRTASSILEQMRPLSVYLGEFLEQNIGQINKIFLELQVPREFMHLDIDENKRILAYRRAKGGVQAIPQYKMKAEQLATLAISVFFTLHFSMPNAPKFILMDESLARTHELSILGLLDFLREMAVKRGTQVIFTTSSPAVASLFRRKFSFMNQEFRNFKFKRLAEQKVCIKTFTYSADSEEWQELE
jgi:hypothetical protein